MQTQFDKTKGTWAINWPGRVSRHDLVYLSPPDDPMRGAALGNGDVGALCWTENSKLIIALNKCDLWENGNEGPLKNVHGEKNVSALRHGGVLTVDFHCPAFDLIYLNNCNGRISLSDAQLQLELKTAFGKINITARVDLNSSLFCLDIKKDFKEKTPVELTLERFGSRQLPYWYWMVTTDTSKGLVKTIAKTETKMMSLSPKLSNGTFTIGVSVRGAKAEYSKLTNNQCRAEINSDKFTIVSAITSPLEKNSLQQCRYQLESFQENSIKQHKLGWKKYWMRSLMETGNDYNDNMWHLTMYYSKASQGKKYPGRFAQGLWSFNHDFQPWGHYFHWNQQQIYWPLEAAGHCEINRAYLEFRFAGLRNAKDDCHSVFDTDGAFVSDVVDHRGYNIDDRAHNHTPVVQIAMDFWRYYQYAQDREFLKNRALPYMIEAAKFFISRFEKRSDGKYHAKTASSYEGEFMIDDATTELASARILFIALLKAMDISESNDPISEKCKDILNNLANYEILELDEEYFNNGKYVMGRFTNDKLKYNRMIAVGRDAKTGKVQVSLWPDKNSKNTGTDNVNDSICKMERNLPVDMADNTKLGINHGIFPFSEFAPIFPHGHLGIKNKNSELFKAAVTTVKNYSQEIIGWAPVPIVLARLGLGRELAQFLIDYAYRWQVSENGWVYWGVREKMKIETALRFRINRPMDESLPLEEKGKIENQFDSPAWNYRHTSMEAMAVLSCAMNESLLQSWDGVIRVAPAVDKKQSSRFTLHATGGFEVSAEIENGKVKWISIKSNTNNTAVIQNPWKKVFVYNKNVLLKSNSKNIFSIQMKKNQCIFLVKNPQDIKTGQIKKVAYSANKIPKKTFNGLAQLGLSKCYA
jgi:hypothetical protein